jgi:hypothetical protein
MCPEKARTGRAYRSLRIEPGRVLKSGERR